MVVVVELVAVATSLGGLVTDGIEVVEDAELMKDTTLETEFAKPPSKGDVLTGETTGGV